MPLQIERWGEGLPIVMVHGSLNAGEAAFGEQKPLAERWELIVPFRRGYGDSTAADRVDYHRDADDVIELLGEGAHLVGTSVGGLVSLLAAAKRPELVWSLTVIEPPALTVAAGDPAVDTLVERVKVHWDTASRDDLEGFLQGFLDILEIPLQLPSPLPPPLAAAGRMLMTETFWQVEVPLDTLARAPFPKLSVSGGESHPAFAAVCDRLAETLPAERVIFPEAGHAVQRIGAPFNERLEAFLREAQSGTPSRGPKVAQRET